MTFVRIAAWAATLSTTGMLLAAAGCATGPAACQTGGPETVCTTWRAGRRPLHTM